ncbi:prepilin-type N-terminal cleavage/methylation domain-containing protein, partial [bacterium]|nr:prepilin-type N-terminal cleavage/methylation domain-containing protein [bacterium]
MIGNKKGFSMMEMVLVLGIFAIATTYALSIFTQSNTVQKRTANIQRSISDARYVLEVMAREFRMGTVDYSYS